MTKDENVTQVGGVARQGVFYVRGVLRQGCSTAGVFYGRGVLRQGVPHVWPKLPDVGTTNASILVADTTPATVGARRPA